MEVIYNGYISVDSFFFMGAVLLATISFKEMDAMLERGKGKITIQTWTVFWFMYYFQRYLRITILYGVIIGIQATFLDLVQGNIERGLDIQADQCKNWWYSNLLYINNWYNDDGNLVK